MSASAVPEKSIHPITGGSYLPENASGIVSFYNPGKDIGPVHQKLWDANIVTSLRLDRKNQNYIRLSPHFYNTDEELNKVLELI